ncbi:MAG: hypothetical protein CBC48_12195 [bacterium TMED88]|nr:hypothetical protein [Deltaproteobacteria bacterium]OUV29117.1 MAG: hypothetical protein CBC48_12195 [bacterium TMED88]
MQLQAAPQPTLPEHGEAMIDLSRKIRGLNKTTPKVAGGLWVHLLFALQWVTQRRLDPGVGQTPASRVR